MKKKEILDIINKHIQEYHIENIINFECYELLDKIKKEFESKPIESKFFKGVSLIDEYNKSITYKCDCDCGSHDHSVWIDFEIDEDYDLFFLNFYKDVYFFDFPQQDILWFDKFKEIFNKKGCRLKAMIFFYENTILYNLKQYWYRFKKAIRLFFTGNLEMSEEFILREGEHLDNFIEALIEGRKIIEKKKNKNRS